MSFEKQNTYYENARSDLLQLFPKTARPTRALDVGCGSGGTGVFLKTKWQVKEVVGIEVNPEKARQAEAVLDRVIIGDVQSLDLPFEKEYFDCIICADVLEHLYDPWAVLLRLKTYLKESGYLLISVPNVQHWSVFSGMLLGRWDYQEEGILDNTHIRFFTRQSIRSMVKTAGFRLEKLHGTMGRTVRFINFFTFQILSGFLSFRYFALVRK